VVVSGKQTSFESLLNGSELRKNIKQNGNIKHIICHKTQRVCFFVTENDLIVSTAFQTFLVRYDHRNYGKQLERLRQMIEKREIKSVVDLVDYCKFRPGGYRDQMCGLMLVPTRLELHL
jgi:hypothetical protein